MSSGGISEMAPILQSPRQFQCTDDPAKSLKYASLAVRRRPGTRSHHHRPLDTRHGSKCHSTAAVYAVFNVYTMITPGRYRTLADPGSVHHDRNRATQGKKIACSLKKEG